MIWVEVGTQEHEEEEEKDLFVKARMEKFDEKEVTYSTGEGESRTAAVSEVYERSSEFTDAS